MTSHPSPLLTTPTDESDTSQPLPNWMFNVLLPLVFWTIACVLMPIASVFQFDTDEGQELIKAVLYNQGFALFTEIWSDQPPLLTLLLAPWLRLWGDSVLASRLLILGLSTLLVWSFAQLLRRSVGDCYALIGTGMLLFTANFLRLSVSVMIGMPALACLLFSLYSLVRYQESQRWWWLGAASIAAGLSLQFKMFTLLLLPLWGLYLWTGQHSGARFRFWDWESWLKLGLWGGMLLVTFFGLGLGLGLISVDHSFFFHVQGDLKAAFVRERSFYDVALFYLQDLDYGVWAIAGTLITLRQSKTRWQFQLNLVPIIWLVWVTVFLLNHKPIWYHHYTLIALPLTWLAVLGLKTYLPTIRYRQFWSQLRHQGWRSLRPPILALGFMLLAFPVKLTLLHLNNQELLHQTQQHQGAIAQIQAEQSPEHPWLFTDIPMYGIHTQRPVPPEIATLSRKRIAAQEFTAESLQDLIVKYDLQQFVIGRFPNVEGFLTANLSDQLQRTEYPLSRYYLRIHT